jgi:hypothetical protein
MVPKRHNSASLIIELPATGNLEYVGIQLWLPDEMCIFGDIIVMNMVLRSPES